ncbi:MAG: chemotaxis response regulator protein-glutamate methylesterase [Spirochaetales bacterium]
MKRIKVLIVDDSAVVREILSNGLSRYPEIEVVGTAGDVFRAREVILSKSPDVLTLDIEMPRMDGLMFLKKLMPQYPIPVIMLSALAGPGAAASLEALKYGAVEVVTKPAANLRQELGVMLDDLAEKIKAAALVDVSKWKSDSWKDPVARIRAGSLARSTDKVVVIGASTGGTVALHTVITAFPPDMAGTVIVQHMPPVFTRLFAEKLDSESQVQVKEAVNGDRIIQGRVLIAPGGFQTTVFRSGGEYLVRVAEGDKVNGHAPSVDVLFDSVAETVGANAVGVVLTGMGRDGAQGLLNMKKAGARTLSQDEKTSLIYGMPKEAWEYGGSELQVPIQNVPAEIIRSLKRMQG